MDVGKPKAQELRSKGPEGDWLRSAAIFGATGGIGAALCRMLADNGVTVHAGSRSGEAPKHHLITPFAFDLEDEASIVAAAKTMADQPPELVVVATGVLTLPSGDGPERSFSAINLAATEKVMRINSMGPALVAKHMLPLMPRDKRWVFSAISAKVGSVAENGLGGWHSYRASKAALNMLIKNFAIEMGRTHHQGVVVGLHPGTVDTNLSKPFQANLADGQLTTRRDAAANLLSTIEQLTPEDSGNLIGWNGETIAP